MHLKCSHYSSTGLSMHWKILTDFAYLLFVTILPLVVMWMPLKNGNYGMAIAWCWIRAFGESCEEVGFLDQMVAGYSIYGAVGIIGLLAKTGVTAAYCRLPATLIHIKALLLQRFMLPLFVILLLLFICACLAIRIYSAVTKWTEFYGMWSFYGAAIPLSHLIIPLGFFGSFYFKHFRNMFCKKRGWTQVRVRVEEDWNATAPKSERQVTPSSIYFSVPYTNGFTTIGTESETTPLCPKDARKKQCVSFV